MALCRLTIVKAARQSPGRCGKCNIRIDAGESYRWWKGRYTPKYVRCLKDACMPELWELETNALRQDHMRAQDDLAKAKDATDAGLAAQLVRDVISSVEGVCEALDERLSAWQGTGLENGQQYESCTSSKDELESWVSEAEGIADELDELDGDEDEMAGDLGDILDRVEDVPELDLGA